MTTEVQAMGNKRPGLTPQQRGGVKSAIRRMNVAEIVDLMTPDQFAQLKSLALFLWGDEMKPKRESIPAKAHAANRGASWNAKQKVVSFLIQNGAAHYGQIRKAVGFSPGEAINALMRDRVIVKIEGTHGPSKYRLA